MAGGGQSRPTVTRPDQRADLCFHGDRVEDRETVDIDDQVAIVGGETIGDGTFVNIDCPAQSSSKRRHA